MTKQEKKFVKEVWDFYNMHGRSSLPWRRTKNAYHILVSEIMLQQTQVDRVIPKYKSFLQRFPTLQKLSEASLGEVLTEWQGLGYNRRAKMLHQCAKDVVMQHKSKLPKEYSILVKLSGIGPYTAGAVIAFAHNEAIPVVETNIRSVIIHHFFKDANDVHDEDILNIVERTLDRGNIREWYYALMDYGVYIKKEFGNPNSRSTHYIKQSTFKGSDREIRGALLRLLSKGSCTRSMILKTLSFEDIRIDVQVEKLLQEGMIKKSRKSYILP